MIAFSSVQLTNLQQFIPDPTLRLNPPANNPFAAAASVSFTQKVSGITIILTDSYPHEAGTISAEKLLEGIISRARRDAERYADSSRAHLNLGLALLNGRHLQEAAREFEIALSLAPTNYVAALNLARVRVMDEKYEDACKLYEVLRKSHPTNPAVLVSWAYILMRRKRFAEAESLLREAVRLDENAPLPRYHLAIVLMNLGKSREAIGQLKAAARADVRSPALHHALGVAYALGGDLRRGTSSLRTALTLAPGMTEATKTLANIFLRQGEAEKAVSLLTGHLAKESSGDPSIREMLAQAYMNLGRHRNACAELLEALKATKGETEPGVRERSRLMNNIGACFSRDRQFQQAAEWLNRAIKTCPTRDAIQYTNLARIYLNQSNALDAWQLLATCRTHFPGDHETRLLLAVSLEMQGRHDEAIHELVDLIQTGEARAEAYADLGWILTDEKRDTDSALKILTEGFRRSPDHLGIVNNLAYVHLLRGETEAARAILKPPPGPGGDTGIRVALTATWGLLRLWEGQLEEGTNYYRQAERIAYQDGNKHLAETTRQKMYLELARAHTRNLDSESARNAVEKGLKVKDGRDYYQEDLESLRKLLETRP